MNKPAATMAELWAKASEDPDFLFQLKAQDVAVTLARAVAEAGLTQAQLAKKLGWKPSRVSHVLSGAGNLTLRTLFDICTVLRFELDVVLRAPHVQRSPQAWETRMLLNDAHLFNQTAQDNMHVSELLLETARQLNRRGWQSANRPLPQPARSKVTYLPSVATAG